MLEILILCTGNSCRSIMAEGLLNHWGTGCVKAYSAGSQPTGVVHPYSVSTLERHGIGAHNILFASKSWDRYADKHFDAVITVCDNAAGEVCPIFPGAPVKAHWGVPDPAACEGTIPEIMAEFDRVFALLEKRVKAFIKAPIETMDRDALQRHLDAVGA